MPPRPLRFIGRHPVVAGAVLVVVAFVILFDWNWLRAPVAKFISNKTEREFRMSRLEVDLGLTSTIRLHDVYFGNAAWGRKDPMAQVPKLEFSVYLPSLFSEKIQIPRLALTDPDVLMELAQDGQRNWRLAKPGTTGPGRAQIQTLSVNRGHLIYHHHGRDLLIDVRADALTEPAESRGGDAEAAPQNDALNTRYQIDGKYKGAEFKGTAMAGNTLSFANSGVTFPVRGHVEAGTTRIDVDGTIADVVRLGDVNTHLKIQGRTLANLYPFLLLPLPASPPYVIEGRLLRKPGHYALEDLRGRIGSTDVTGGGAYVVREPRPLLTATLKSNLLNMSDLGPLIGADEQRVNGNKSPGQGETRNRATAVKNTVRRDKIFPGGDFEGERFRAIDAEVDLDAAKLRAPTALPVESLKASLRLRDGVLRLAPLQLGFGGGTIASELTLDGREDALRGDADIKFSRIRLDRLVPKAGSFAKSSGIVGGSIQLKGAGNSVAELFAQSSGGISAAIAEGRLSNLVDAASGLNGGKVLSLLAGGDKQIAIRCGAATFKVEKGQATATMFVIDTEETQILGEGGFNLGKETWDMRFSPLPKEAGILSMRTPVQVHGTFRKPDYTLERGPLAAKAAGAVALALINPLAALLPLVETGPGEDTDCRKVLAKVPAATAR